MSEEQTLNLTVQPDAVAAPTTRMVAFVTEAVGTALRALGNDDCVEEEGWGGALSFKFNGLQLNPDDRRKAFTNWVLAKGFQDLARGIRETLEEGYFVVKVLELGSHFKTTTDHLEALFGKLRADAQKLSFPDLMAQLNQRLQVPLSFDAEFLSLQKARNCLEHRGGRVGSKDVDPVTGTLILSFPRLMLYYVQQGEEVEIVCGQPIHGDNSHPFAQAEVTIFTRRVTRSRDYALNEPLVITFNDFLEIAFACQLFADDVAIKIAQNGSQLTNPHLQ